VFVYLEDRERTLDSAIAAGGVRHVIIAPHRDLSSGAAGLCALPDAEREVDDGTTDFLLYLLAGSAAERRLVGRTSDRADFDVRQARNRGDRLKTDPASMASPRRLRALPGRVQSRTASRWVDLLPSAVQR
jgi:hypothetical protein